MCRKLCDFCCLFANRFDKLMCLKPFTFILTCTQNARIADTIETLTFWQQKWILCQCCSAATRMRHTNNTAKSQQEMMGDGAAIALQNTSKADYQIEVIQATTKKLLECSSLQSPTKTFWHSQGGLRFLLLKRAIDLVYVSIGSN